MSRYFLKLKYFPSVGNKIYYMKRFIKTLKDPLRRAELLLLGGLIINACYALFKLTTAIYYRSFWPSAVGAYYILLCSLKFYLLRQGFSKGARGRIPENCGKLLLLLNATICAIIFYLVRQNKGFSYSDRVLTLSAVYTVFRVVSAFRDGIILRHKKSPILFSVSAVSRSVALMALFSLQVTLLDRLGVEPSLKQLINLIGGAAITLLLASISLTLLKRQK